MITRAAVALLALLTLTAASVERGSMLVTPGWLAEHLADPGLVLLHVGTPEGYAQHIPGARLVSSADIALTGDNGTLEMPPPEDLRQRLAALGISDQSRIVVYYGQNQIAPATRVIFTLEAAGLGARTSLLDGGMAGWVRAGNATTADIPPPRTGNLAPLKMQSRIVDAAFVRDHVSRAGWKVIDARLPAFYKGEQTGGSKERPHKTGHIAGARNVPFSEVSDANLSVRPAEALKAAFEKAGVKAGDKLVVYCHIGQQATAIIYAARSLGYDAVLYDGSFEDWSKRDLPTETAN